MTFVAAVAAGLDAADALAATCSPRGADVRRAVVRHRHIAVAWSTSCPWVEVGDDGEVLVVLDGRLHNLYPESEAQAQWLLDRYRRFGVGVGRGLLGDFVLIILDRRTDTLLLARDPVGVRPWYQATSGVRHAGASDLATLVSFPWVDTTVNESAALEYLAAIRESRGETLYRGVSTLRPGQTWHLAGGAAKTFSHHEWEIEPQLDISWDDAAERCRHVLNEAVSCRLREDCGATSQLSGGLDSSAVVGTVALLARKELLVGRLLFESPRADERVFSDAVIQHWGGLRAVSAEPWIPRFEELWDLSRHLRRPSPEPHFTMFVGLHRELLAEGRPEGLTGLGGDDAFMAKGIGPRVLSSVQLRKLDAVSELGQRFAKNPKAFWPEILKPTLGYLAGPWRRGGHPAWVSRTAAARVERLRRSRRRAERVTGISAIDERLAPLTAGYDAAVLETHAIVADWIGRRESHPFLDPRFIRATYGLDPSWPSKGGHNRALQVAAFGDRLPPSVAQRRSKAEFSAVFWPQTLHDDTLERVRTGPLQQLGWLDSEGLEELITNAKRGMANAAIPLFRCVSLDEWMRTA